jgi:hypothetical protein
MWEPPRPPRPVTGIALPTPYGLGFDSVHVQTDFSWHSASYQTGKGAQIFLQYPESTIVGANTTTKVEEKKNVRRRERRRRWLGRIR